MLQRLNSEKIIVSGDRIRRYAFKGRGWRYIDAGGGSKGFDGERLESNVYRARKAVRLLLECNVRISSSWFLTLTFRDNVADRQVAISEWTRFSKALSRWFGVQSGYLCVPERQKRGAWHFHIVIVRAKPLVDFVRQTEEMRKLWRSSGYGGSVHLERVRHRKGISLYISKYITKELCDDVPFGKRSYFPSRNLKRPIIYGDKELREIRKRLLRTVKRKSPDFSSDFACRDGRAGCVEFYRKATIKEVI